MYVCVAANSRETKIIFICSVKQLPRYELNYNTKTNKKIIIKKLMRFAI